MKYLKAFETKNLKYKKGDYVLLDLEEIDKENIRTASQEVPDSNLGLIVSLDTGDKNVYPYTIKSPDSKRDHRFREEEIIRHLTQSEINEFDLTSISKQYNI